MDSFERAVEAVISGDLDTLRALLRDDPSLVRARSQRPHHATLLHYVSANGVEDERQKTPPNAVDVARMLLEAGADVDALADTYARDLKQTTMYLLVSSIHPHLAGLQEQLVELLLDFGAAIDGVEGEGTPLMTALAFHYPRAAETLARRGARVDTLPAAAGIGRLDLVRQFIDQPGIEQAFLWAATFGRREVVALLLPRVDLAAADDQGMTALHWAAWYGQIEVVDFLIERGAPLDAVNKYGGTPLSATIWASQHSDRRIDWAPAIERLRRASERP